jgi:hypothetical protein
MPSSASVTVAMMFAAACSTETPLASAAAARSAIVMCRASPWSLLGSWHPQSVQMAHLRENERVSEDSDWLEEYARLGYTTRREFRRLLRAHRHRLEVEAAERRDAEEKDRCEWIEGIRRRLGLVSEVHEWYVRQIGESYWAWACSRPGCRDGGPDLRPWNCGHSKAAVTRKAREHARRFLPGAPETVPGAGLDLTGWGPAGR